MVLDLPNRSRQSAAVCRVRLAGAAHRGVHAPDECAVRDL